MKQNRMKRLTVAIALTVACLFSVGLLSACDSNVDLDNITGNGGTQGPQGETGAPGVGIQSITLTEDGKMLITYTDGTSATLDIPTGTNGETSPDASTESTPDADTLPDGGEESAPAATYSEGLAFRLNNDRASYTLTGLGECRDTDVVIPPEHNGLPVTAIANSAFNGDTYITSVSVPGTVKIIHDMAFHYCTALSEITLGDGIEVIRTDAFTYTRITSLVIPDSVTEIQVRAFSYNECLSEVTMSTGVVRFGNEIFNECSRLGTFHYNGTMSEWNNIVKTYNWIDHDGYTVHCTDGTI